MGPGEAFVNQVYGALIANAAAWQRTLLIITFDEHGGTYDHLDSGGGCRHPESIPRAGRLRLRSVRRARADTADLTVGFGGHGVPFAELDAEVRPHIGSSPRSWGGAAPMPPRPDWALTSPSPRRARDTGESWTNERTAVTPPWFSGKEEQWVPL
jgi:hypothetical protein